MPDVNDTVAVLRSLRATRSFRDDPVPAALVGELLDIARWTGSARNRQPWRVAVVTDRARRAELSQLGAYAAHLSGAPVVVLLALDVERVGLDGEFDAGRFAQSLMLAAHAHGLGSCPATFFPDDNVLRATRLAGFQAPWRVRTAISLGYPAPVAAPAPPVTGARSAIPRGRLPLDIIDQSSSA